MPREKVLKTTKGVLTEDRFDNMHTWPVNSDHLAGWIKSLEKYNVFFSSPLDIDFLFLEHFTESYQSIIPEGGGPHIPNKEHEPAKYEKKIRKGVIATLKSEKVTGETYTAEQRELMIWYNYHFLGRGKPSTHIQALSTLSDKDLKVGMPPVLTRMFQRIEKMLTII